MNLKQFIDGSPDELASMYGRGLELVEWVDSVHFGSGWVDMGMCESVDAGHRCVSVGFIVRETAGVVVLAPHISPDIEGPGGDVIGMLSIPKSAIVRRFPVHARTSSGKNVGF